MQSKVGGYLGISRKANYLIIGSDDIKTYNKKMYLIIVSNDCSDNILKIAKNKAIQYNISCIKFNFELSSFIGVDSCKVVGLKNKGLSDEILKYPEEYTRIV